MRWGMEMVIRQSDHIACLPSHLSGGRSSDTKNFYVLSFDSSLTVLRSIQVVGFAWILDCIRSKSQKEE
jgi:hypothetical protein